MFDVKNTAVRAFFVPLFCVDFFGIFEGEKSTSLCMSLFLTENPLFFTNFEVGTYVNHI